MFRKWIPWVCLVAAVGLARPGAAAQLKGVQSGSVTITGGTTSITDTLSPAVVPAKSFLVFGISGSSNTPHSIQVSGQLTSSTTVTFSRLGTTGNVTVHWYVAEFLSGVNVQRGSLQMPEPLNPADTDVPISTVDLTKSFPLISFRTDGSSYDAGDSIRAKLTTTTNLRLFAQDAGTAAFVEWQVVEYFDANVQTGDVVFGSGDLSRPATLAPSVTTAKSWLVFSHQSTTAPPDIGRTLVRGVVTNGTTLTFDRNNTGSGVQLTWYLVEFTDAATVQHNTEPFTTTELQRNVTLGSPANAGSSIAAGGYHGRGGRSSFATDDDPGVGWFTLDLTSNTNLQITRGTTGGDTATADIGWFVVDFVANSCAPLNVSETGSSITVTAPSDFEMTFHTAAGGSIREMYDLQEDPGKANDLAGALIGSGSSMGLHNAGMRIGAPHFNAGEDPAGYLELLEATPTRVRVRQLSDYVDVNVRLGGVEAEGDYTILPSGKIGLRWTRKTTAPITYTTEYVESMMHETSAGPLSGRVVSSETNLVSPGGGLDDFLLAVIDNSGPPPVRTDFLYVLHEDWDTVNGYSATADSTNWFFQSSAERVNPGWIDTTGQVLGAGDVETWNLLTYFRPRTLLDNTDPAVTARSADYRVPDPLTIGIGSAWTHASENTGAGDDFNESEVAYVMEADPSMDPTLRVDIDGGGGATRYAPFFKIREWHSLRSPTVTLQASPLTQGIDFQADVKPVSRSYFADELLWHSTAQNAAAWTTTPDVGTGGFASGAITYVPGRHGNGVNMPANTETLSFPTINFDKFQGALEFWFQPTYAHDDGVGRDIGGFFFDASNAWFIQKTVTDNRLHFRIVASGVTSDLWIDPADYEWQAAEWVHLRIEWDETAGLATQQRLYINGVEPAHTDPTNNYVAATLTVAGSFNIGNNTNGSGDFGPGIYDEVRSYGGSTASPDALAHGGLGTNASEYLASGARNYTLNFNAVDANSRGRYLYFGADSQFHGLNVSLATRGVGTATLVWEFWNGTQWASLAGFGFTDETADFTADGTIYWTDPTGWSTYSVNGTPDLYYVRVHATAVAYTTLPVEAVIKTDILLFQYCGDITANAQRFEFALPVPTAVELIGFDANGADGEVELLWETGSELQNLGFHLYRAPSAAGLYERITPNLIPGLGSSPAGARYRYLDAGLVNGVTYFYELEDVETTGATERHGPVAATPAVGVSLPGDVTEENDTAARITYGTPESSTLRVLPRKGGVILELDTTGFVAVPQDDGTVRLVVPGLDEYGTSLPAKRAWVDALAGRNVDIVSVRALDVESFDGLRPASAATPELVVSSEGTVRARRRRQQRRIYRSEGARVVTLAYQGEQKKALVELSPFSWDGSRLWLARKLRVRLAFRGREIQSKVKSHRKRGVVTHLVTVERGLYAVSLQELLGRRRARTSKLRLSRQGSTVAYHIESDTFYFWSEGERANPYGREAVYELEVGAYGETMEVVDSATRPRGPFHWHAVEREENRYYQAALVNAPDVWLWDVLFAPARKSFGFDIHHLAAVSVSEPSRLELWLQGTSDIAGVVDHHVRVYVNGSFIAEAQWDGKNAYQLTAEVGPGVVREGENELEIENVGDTGAAYSMIMLDRFRLEYPRAWSALDNADHVIELSGDAPRWVTSGGLRHEGRYESVTSVIRPGLRTPIASRLKRRRQADYLVIGPEAFLNAASSLLAHRREQGLRVRTASIEEIGSAFGYGELSPEAVRDFIKYAYHEWRSPSLRYVLLLGDATYDFKDALGTGVTNQVPPFMIKTSYLWTASDPAYAAVNGDDLLPDVAIGRLPARSTDELRVMVDKILAFETGERSGDAPFVLIADGADDAGNFARDADEIASTLLATRLTTKIYLDELGTTSTRASILQSFDDGASLVSYLGHGAIHLWAGENLFNTGNVGALSPQSRQPLLLTMNCLNGYFHFPYFDSLAEALVKAEGKGAIAAFSPSGLSLNAPAHRYHKALLQELLSGGHSRLGDAILEAQKRYADTGAFPELLSIYHLFGDPALQLDFELRR